MGANSRLFMGPGGGRNGEDARWRLWAGKACWGKKKESGRREHGPRAMASKGVLLGRSVYAGDQSENERPYTLAGIGKRLWEPTVPN